MIGGVGERVEVDESKFAKHKYHRGHRVGDGKSWVFGGIQTSNVSDGEKKPYFAVVVENRTRETLEGCIRKYIREGTTIVSDGWRAYMWLEHTRDYDWEMVNHSNNFVNPETGVCTNTIEGKWHGIKCRVPKRNRSGLRLDSHLREMMWRDQNKNDLWEAFLVALAEVCSVGERD